MTIELGPERIVEYGQMALSILIVVLLGLVTYHLIRRGLNILHQSDYISEAVQGILQITLRWIVVVLVLLVSLQQVGLQMTSIWAALSAFVVLIGVGFVAIWSVLSNVLCSMLLLLFKPFNLGDEIEITEATGGQGLRGKVVNLNLLYTFLIEEDSHKGTQRAIVQVPNKRRSGAGRVSKPKVWRR